MTIKLTIAKSFKISHPKPPAPTTKTLASANGDDEELFAISSKGSNSPFGKSPVSLPNGEGRLNNVKRFPRSSFL
jgi:hypothetical protein